MPSMKAYLLVGASLVVLLAQTGCALNLHQPTFGANGPVPAGEVQHMPARSNHGERGPGLVVDRSDHGLVADLR